MNPAAELETPAARIRPLLDNIRRVFIGKPEAALCAAATLLARGHLLIEDVPGIGKTLLGQALSRSIDSSFRRIQFTNDLLPSDILGLTLYDQGRHSFEFRPGPLFSHVVLADEINRATPKTQSALLEAMNDSQVTIDGKTYALPELFMVIATQNPVEYHGTFPLPEAQIDRFLMRIRIGYPSEEDEKLILREQDPSRHIKELRAVLSVGEVMALQDKAREVRMEEALLEYVASIARATRSMKSVRLGASPRGALALARSARAWALMDGRDYCVPDDVKRVAVPVLAHRLLLDAGLHGLARVEASENAVSELLEKVPSP